MKLVKLLSLAAVAAFAAMAFVGASSASAEPTGVLLCEKLVLICTTPWKENGENKKTIAGTAVNPTLLSSIGNVECEKSEAEITLLQGPKLEKLIFAHILKLNFTGNCHLNETKCTVTVGSLGGITITHGPNPLEWIGRAAPLESKNTEATVKCGFFINCTYVGGEETATTATNSESGEVTLTAEKAELKKSSGLCPEVSKWDAVYKATTAGLWLES